MKKNLLGLVFIALLAVWVTPGVASAAILYRLEGEGCFVYSPYEFGGDGEGGCHPITGSIRMPDSYVPGTEFVFGSSEAPPEDTPFFYLYMYTWSPINPVVREYMTTHGSITLPVSSGPASWLWCSLEGCSGVNSDAGSDGSFRWAIAESWAIVGTQRYTLVPTYAPEPGTLAMLGLGLAGLGLGRRRRVTVQ